MLNRFKARWRSAGWNEFVLLTTLVTVCVGVWIFVELAGAVAGNSHLETETKIMRAFRNPADLSQPIGPWWLGELARDITSLGSALMVITMTLLVSGFLLLRKQYGRVLLIVLTIGGGYALNKTLKLAFDRTRPDIVPHLVEVSTSSFPSGHSMASSVVYITLAALLAQASQSRREKIYIILAAFFLTFVIGLSRVFLGVHYPTDVLAGWSAGTAWALVCWLIAERFFKRSLPSETTRG